MAKKDQLADAASNASTTPKAPILKDCDSSAVEAWLQSFGVGYSSLLTLPMSQIDERKSRANQARPTALVEEAVSSFAIGVKNGDAFPPVVGYVTGAGTGSSKLVIIDGNNRHAAHLRAGATHIRAYALAPDTPSETISAMMVDANARHGTRTDSSWRVTQAEHLVGLGFSVEDACNYAKIPKQKLLEHQRAVRAQMRAKNLKISGFSDLPAHHQLRLGGINSDPVFLQAARVVIDTGMTIADLSTFFTELKPRIASSEQAAITYIAKTSDERKAAARAAAALGKTPRVTSSKHSLLTALGKLMHVDPAAVARMVLTDMDRAILSSRLSEAAEKILELQIAMETITKEAMRDAS